MPTKLAGRALAGGQGRDADAGGGTGAGVTLRGRPCGGPSLHNIEQIERLGIHIGDTVVIEKAGEIIPQVVQAVTEQRPKDARPIVAPDEVPPRAASR